MNSQMTIWAIVTLVAAGLLCIFLNTMDVRFTMSILAPALW